MLLSNVALQICAIARRYVSHQQLLMVVGYRYCKPVILYCCPTAAAKEYSCEAMVYRDMYKGQLTDL